MANPHSKLRLVQQQLSPYRIKLNRALGPHRTSAPHAHGHATFEATETPASGTPSKVHIEAFDLAALPASPCLGERLVTYCAIAFPHVVQLRKLIPTPDYLCVLAEAVEGGDVFSMARRAGPGGLPPPAARFLIQQLLSTADFLQFFGVHVHEVSPSGFLVHWNDRGMPIVKLALPCLRHEVLAAAEVLGAGKVLATMLSCPQAIRQESVGGGPDAERRFAAARDAWALAVTLYFLLYGRWPFSQQQMQGWARQRVWRDDEAVAYEGVNNGPPPAMDVVPLLRRVFACGGCSAAEFARKCPSVRQMQEHGWIVQDLPDGAREMAETFRRRTEARRETLAFRDLERKVQEALTAVRSGARPPPAHA